MFLVQHCSCNKKWLEINESFKLQQKMSSQAELTALTAAVQPGRLPREVNKLGQFRVVSCCRMTRHIRKKKKRNRLAKTK